MKQQHRNPHEGIRIDLPVDEALRRSLSTPAPTKAQLEAFIRKDKAAEADKRTRSRRKAKPTSRRHAAHR